MQSYIKYSFCRLLPQFIYSSDFFTDCYGKAIEPACPRKYIAYSSV